MTVLAALLRDFRPIKIQFTQFHSNARRPRQWVMGAPNFCQVMCAFILHIVCSDLTHVLPVFRFIACFARSINLRPVWHVLHLICNLLFPTVHRCYLLLLFLLVCYLKVFSIFWDFRFQKVSAEQPETDLAFWLNLWLFFSSCTYEKLHLLDIVAL